MANVFNNTTNLTLLVETAYDRKADWVLRSMPQFRAVVDKRPVAQAMPGDVVVFTINGELASLATTPLSETVDLDAVARPAPTRVSVTLNEYGNAEINTIKLEKLAFTDPRFEMGETIARNMADTMDRLVRDVMETGTQVIWQDDDGTLDTADPGTLGNGAAKGFAAAAAKLRGDNVQGRRGDLYVAYIHPDVSYDVRLETGEQGWLHPHADGGDTSAIYAGEIGTFVGNVFIETPRCPINSGDYTSFILGREYIAEACAIEPHVVVGPVVDKLKRFNPLGWHAMCGWALYRNEAGWQYKTNSSIASL